MSLVPDVRICVTRGFTTGTGPVRGHPGGYETASGHAVAKLAITGNRFPNEPPSASCILHNGPVTVPPLNSGRSEMVRETPRHDRAQRANDGRRSSIRASRRTTTVCTRTVVRQRCALLHGSGPGNDGFVDQTRPRPLSSISASEIILRLCRSHSEAPLCACWSRRSCGCRSTRSRT